MAARDAIAVFAVYVFVYYGIARWAFRIYVHEERLSPDLLNAGVRSSSRMVAMLLDLNLPRADQSSRFRFLLFFARGMLLAAPVIAVLLILL
jgi:hypothetical protein